LTYIVVAPDERITIGKKLLEQGPERQSASKACWVGPSSVMNASDLDGYTFAQPKSFGIGVKAHCPFKENLRSLNRCAQA
jgi:hypothetical protein